MECPNGQVEALRDLAQSFPPQTRNYRLALESLDRVGLISMAVCRVDTLSGGQQQRVGIARALTQQPRLIRADACRARPSERTGARPPNRMLRTTLGLALGNSLVPFVVTGLAGGPADFLSRVAELLAVGLGGLLSRAFLDRTPFKTRYEKTPLLTEPL